MPICMIAATINDPGLLVAGAVFRDQFRQPVCAESRWGKQPLGESIQSESAWKLAEGE